MLSSSYAIVHLYIAEVGTASVEYEEVTCKQMSVKEIYAATENLHLSNIIGQGIAGTYDNTSRFRTNLFVHEPDRTTGSRTVIYI